MVHEIFSLEKITKLKIRHPKAKVIAHPECEEQVLAVADYIGSTTGLFKYSQADSAKNYCGYRNRYPTPDAESQSGQNIYSCTSQ
jgi:quinolinate synthase